MGAVRGGLALAVLLLLGAGALLPGSLASIDRLETYSGIGADTLDYFVTEEYTSAEARDARTLADTDTSGSVSPSEATAYAEAAAALRLGNASLYVKWDGAAATWKSINASALGLDGVATSGAPFSLTLEGVLSLTSQPGGNHSLAITRPPAYGSWNVTIVIPPTWSFGNRSGAASIDENGSRLTAALDIGVAVFEIEAPAPPVGAPPSAAFPAWAIPAAVVVAGGLVAVVALRRSRHVAAPEAAAPPPAYALEGFLLLYKDGRLLYHQEADGQGRLTEPEILGSMFAAVSEFIQDSFHERATSSRLTHGHNTILLERSAHFCGAAILFGEPDERLREEMHHVLEQAEAAFAGLIEKWSGDKKPFEGAASIVSPLFALTSGVSRAQVAAGASPRSVRLLSETEHYRGYIRLKVAITNDTAQPITGAAVSVSFNEDVLRLARVDPLTFARDGALVQVGTVNPGERMCVNYLLDPQTCSHTNIEGRVTYQDSDGKERSATMKTRNAEIVCPIFFTPGQANAATLERRMEAALFVRDARSYRVSGVAAGVSFNDVFAAARDAVQRHDVRLVRSLATPSPYEGKAWFFGQTKVGAHDMIVRVIARQQDNTVEFYVATDAPAALTGVLAELGRSFKELVAQRMPAASLEPVYAEGAAPEGDTLLSGLLDEEAAADP